MGEMQPSLPTLPIAHTKHMEEIPLPDAHALSFKPHTASLLQTLETS